MNAEALLKHYERVADAPDAVGRLRLFVLDLAVRGKLVEQNPSDEPTRELLGRTSGDKAKASKSQSTRDRLAPPVVSPPEQPFEVPNGWTWVRLANVADFSAGRTPSRHDSSLWNTGDYAWASIADMENGKLLTVTKETVSNRAKEIVFDAEPESPGTIIMSFKLTIGKIARLAIPAFHNEAIISIKPLIVDLDPYLFKVLPQFARKGNTKGAIKGATLNRESLSNILIPLPPLAEQRRIVAKVDELMALCDRLEAARAEREATRDRLAAVSLARLNTPDSDHETFKAHASFAISTALPAFTTRPDQIKQLRITILNLAIQGRLVPQNPSDEPIETLLLRIGQFRASQLGKSRDRGTISVLRDGCTPYDAPAGWVWARFGDIIVSRDGERVPVSKEERNTKEKLFDYYGASGVIDKIDGFLFNKPLLLIGEDGANLISRSTPIAFIARGQYWVNNHAHVIDGLSEEFLQYMELFINAIDLKPYVTGTAQPKMNQAKMNTIMVALPPSEEQVRIVTKVNELMQLCDQLEASLESGSVARCRLLDALLHEALAPTKAIEEAA